MPHPFLEIPAYVKVAREGHLADMGVNYIKVNIFDVTEVAPSGVETCILQYSSGREREVIGDYRAVTDLIEGMYEEASTFTFEPGDDEDGVE